MEIISYVGAASPAGRRSHFHFGLHSFLNRKILSKRFSAEFSSRRNSISFTGILDRAEDFVLSAKNTSAYAWLFSAAFACVLVPVTAIHIAKQLERRTGPVELQAVPPDEVALIDKAMSQFALAQDDDDVDENGNVLSSDGKILTAASVGVGQKVTFSTWKVKAGDSISSIARRAGLTNISTLIAVNDIDNVRSLRAGQKLRVPSQDGIIHTVSSGESLNLISARYHVSIEELCDANDLQSRYIHAGQELFVPGVKLDSASLRKALGELFMVPLSAGWRLTSHFGSRADPFTGVRSYHTGIDMAVPTGTPIKAAMSGRIAYVGWSNVFGNYVIINHSNGYQTLYGHMSKTLARVGQDVSQGTRIGLVGSTGYSTGPHLHFTVYKNGKLVDPLTLIK